MHSCGYFLWHSFRQTAQTHVVPQMNDKECAQAVLGYLKQEKVIGGGNDDLCIKKALQVRQGQLDKILGPLYSKDQAPEIEEKACAVKMKRAGASKASASKWGPQ